MMFESSKNTNGKLPNSFMMTFVQPMPNIWCCGLVVKDITEFTQDACVVTYTDLFFTEVWWDVSILSCVNSCGLRFTIGGSSFVRDFVGSFGVYVLRQRCHDKPELGEVFHDLSELYITCRKKCFNTLFHAVSRVPVSSDELAVVACFVGAAAC